MSTGSKFCDRCGEGIPSPQNKFCPACGSDLSQGNNLTAETSNLDWFQGLQWSLVILGSGLLFLGMTFVNQATLGLGLIAVACFLGIMARIAQGEWHEKRARRDMRED